MINSPKLTQPTVKHPVLSWYGRIINCYVTFMYSTLQCALVHNLEHPHCKKILFSDISLRRFCFHWNVTKSLIQDPYYLLFEIVHVFFVCFSAAVFIQCMQGKQTTRPSHAVNRSAWTHVMQMPAAWYPCLVMLCMDTCHADAGSMIPLPVIFYLYSPIT